MTIEPSAKDCLTSPCNLLTVTNQGNARWMIIDGRIDEAFNSEKLYELLEALIKETGKKSLLMDNLRVPHSKPVAAWAAESKSEGSSCFTCPAAARNSIPRSG